MKVIDLAKAIAPQADIEMIGIRPGEKLHEAMITEDDARHTVEFDRYYVIVPQFPWCPQQYVEEGKPLPEGFKYTSDTNTEWLTVEELRELVRGIKVD